MPYVEEVVLKEKIVPSNILASTSNFAITMNVWTSQLTNDLYITVTCHYINEEWGTRSVVQATQATKECHTADNMRNYIKNVLAPIERTLYMLPIMPIPFVLPNCWRYTTSSSALTHA